MKYLFYRLWQLLTGSNPNMDEPPMGAMTILSLFQFFNIATLDIIVHHFFDIGLKLNNENEVIIYSIVPIFIVVIFNVFYLFRRRNLIEMKYKNESTLNKKIGNFLLFAYGILSIALLIIIGSAYPIG